MTIGVLIVDDSPLCRDILRDLLEEEGDICVIGEAGDGYRALALVEELRPDLVTMDLDMPGADGLETVSMIMARTPVPILVVTGRPMGPDSDLAFRAMERGALDLLPKLAFAKEETRVWIRAQVRACARTPVFLNAPQATPETIRPHLKATIMAPPSRVRGPARLVVLIAGTGGTATVADLISRLPPGLACPIAVVQRGPMQLSAAYAKFLAARTTRTVEILGAAPHQCVPGTIVIPGDERHLACPTDGLLVAVPDEPETGRVPAMLRSVVSVYGDEALVVILSGLESDELEGLDAMREAGALILAEEPLGAAQPAMPRAAMAAGAVERAFPIDELARAIYDAAC